MKFYNLQLRYILSEVSSKQTEMKRKKTPFMQISVAAKLHMQ